MFRGNGEWFRKNVASDIYGKDDWMQEEKERNIEREMKERI